MKPVFIESGHFTAFVDAYDIDSPVIEITMHAPLYASDYTPSMEVDHWNRDLSSELDTLYRAVHEYLSNAAAGSEVKAYAV